MGKKLSTEEFVKRGNIIHGFRYDYSQTEYFGYDLPLVIVCPKHGPFKQRAHDHLDGCGCPECVQFRSKAEIRLSEFIESLGFYVINNSRNELDGSKKELDIFIPSAKIGIEFNGLRWHCSEFRGYPEMHRNKYEECLNNNIRLIQFYEDAWWNDRDGIFKTTSDILFGRDIKDFELKDEINVNLDIGIGIDLKAHGFKLVFDSGPIPYRVFNNYKNKEKIENAENCNEPIIWLSGEQVWRKKNISTQKTSEK